VKRARAWSGGLILASLVLAAAGVLAAREDQVIRLLPPDTGELTGPVTFEALVIEPEPWSVVFLVDGVEAERRKLPPWQARVRLDAPPREQIVRVEVRNRGGEVVGSDELVVNRPHRPLRVTIEALEPLGESGVSVRARVSLPESVELDSVAVFLNRSAAGTYAADELEDGVLTVGIRRAGAQPSDFIRVEARLADGRTIEDVELVDAPGFTDEVDVRLVQLQVLVTDKRGAPVLGLERQHFRVRDGRELEEPDALFPAPDISLLLGLALDSSGSMRPLWPVTRLAAVSFLTETLGARDQGFLVDFDTRLTLVRSRTADVADLISGIDELEPEGGTALYDSILYSLIQFERQQGRRGLVVLTDGYDVNSASDPRRVIEFGKKLGVPIYILAIEPSVGGRGSGLTRGGGLGPGSGGAVHSLRLLTEPTGGRLFHIPSAEHLQRAFAQIRSELRNQYVLTYYTDQPPAAGEPPIVQVEVPGMKGLDVRTVFAADQIY
jgi:VWFA-related protein